MANDRGRSGKGSAGALYLPGQAMICPDCNGARYAVIRGRVIPCSTCGGCGLASCCDGAVGCGLDVVNGELAEDFRIAPRTIAYRRHFPAPNARTSEF